MLLLYVKLYLKIDTSDWNNFKKRSKIYFGFQTEKELKPHLEKDLITLDSFSQFKKDAFYSLLSYWESYWRKLL